MKHDSLELERKHDRQFLRFVIIAAVAALGLLAAIIFFDYQNTTKRSMLDRIELLERQAKEKSRPVIHVQRATIYNAKGEIAIRTIEPPESRKGG